MNNKMAQKPIKIISKMTKSIKMISKMTLKINKNEQ